MIGVIANKIGEAVVDSVDDCEAATSVARDQIRTDGGGEDEDPKPLCMALINLLSTWTKLQETDAEMKKSADGPTSKVVV